MKKKLDFFVLLFLVVVCLAIVDKSKCANTLDPISPVALGATATLTCVSSEPASVVWSRSSYNGAGYIIIFNNNPAGYSISATVSASTLTIASVTSQDFATFTCSGASGTSSGNLTLLVTTTQAPTTTTSFDPATLCYNGRYNDLLYALLLISMFVLGIILVLALKFSGAIHIANVFITIGCFLGAIAFLVISLIFWISPSFAGLNYVVWSTIIVVTFEFASIIVLWCGIVYFLLRSFFTDRTINWISLLVTGFIILAQIALLLAIFCSIAYCTGTTSMKPLSTNYSVVSDICAALFLGSCLILFGYFLYVYKERLARSIGVVHDVLEHPKDFTKSISPFSKESPIFTIKKETPLGVSSVDESPKKGGIAEFFTSSHEKDKKTTASPQKTAVKEALANHEASLLNTARSLLNSGRSDRDTSKLKESSMVFEQPSELQLKNIPLKSTGGEMPADFGYLMSADLNTSTDVKKPTDVVIADTTSSKGSPKAKKKKKEKGKGKKEGKGKKAKKSKKTDATDGSTAADTSTTKEKKKKAKKDKKKKEDNVL